MTTSTHPSPCSWLKCKRNRLSVERACVWLGQRCGLSLSCRLFGINPEQKHFYACFKHTPFDQSHSVIRHAKSYSDVDKTLL